MKRTSAQNQKAKRSTAKKTKKRVVQSCVCCSKELTPNSRALFVEEEIGRIFCSENCIAAYFEPEIKKLEREYFKNLSHEDLTGEERESIAHLRWLTLQNPDEVWITRTSTGDQYFTLISEYQPDQTKVWSICICLFLRGEPSFLFLAFPTQDARMANYYRRGKRVQTQRKKSGKKGRAKSSGSAQLQDQGAMETAEVQEMKFVDGLADAWTEDETLRAQVSRDRSTKDIPVEEFSLYQSCMEETLQTPDEVWSVQMKGKHPLHLYHFIKYYPDETPGVWYVIIAKETEDEEQIEILDAFPTRDVNLIEQFRMGTQEVGQRDEGRPPTRMVH